MTARKDFDTRLIETSEQLILLCQQLETAPWLALDTEFHRERTYYPQLCLVQVATPELCACIDAILLPDLSPLLEILYNHKVIKIFHSASQDLEVLYQLRAQALHPLFDTQIAATLLGYRDQIGYGALVKEMLGLSLAKDHTRTDWRRRPLSRDQLAYAADDVIHLAKIYPLLCERLEEQERLHWLEEDFSLLGEVSRYLPDPLRAWERIRNSTTLRGRQWAALQALAAWRENMACRLNRPRGWLIRDELLLQIAQELPESRKALETIAAGQRSAIGKYSGELLSILDSIHQEAPATPGPPASRRLDTEEKALVEQLLKQVQARCQQAELDPQAVTGRRELGRLIQGERRLRILRGWRRCFIGEELLAEVGK